MRTLLVIAVIAIVARASATSSMPPAVLTSSDIVPTQSQLDTELGSGAMSQLTSLAATPSTYVGPRLRAIYALVGYCGSPCAMGDPAHDTLTTIINAQPVPQSGSDLLVLRAAIESLGRMKDPNDVGVIAPFLNHNSRDVRATAATALGTLCSTSPTAISALRNRTQYETVDQVKLAISSALRALSNPPTSCQ